MGRGRWGVCRGVIEACRQVLLGFAVVGFAVGIVCWVGYGFARVFVLVESFAALRGVESAVYTTVEWTDFVPHAG